ncbi:adhesion G protein-coupled receptor E5 isoform X2 [Lates calcarifer]|uniref:Adhesion G protein-coupled receptor E5 isoform X2 n=1 Tax=Lates calcarifer TaxID=8187 RepID=A0AAJ8BBG0_LATCA|nr:adhesion G protein-coupled receptor E5 isoform X2 [Lates calcarifer]
MVGRWNLLILALCLSLMVLSLASDCPNGFVYKRKQGCIDYDECEVDKGDTPPCQKDMDCINTNGSFICKCKDGFQSQTESSSAGQTCRDINECDVDNICGANTICNNKISSYSCTCRDGFISSTGVKEFHGNDNVTCTDIDECGDKEENVCGQNVKCINTPGHYRCVCNLGFGLKSGKSNFTGNQEQCEDIDECRDKEENVCGQNAKCINTPGHYRCVCNPGFGSGKSNFTGNQEQCEVIKCDGFEDMLTLTEKFPVSHDVMTQLKKSCLRLKQNQTVLKGEDLLERLLFMIDDLSSCGAFSSNRKVSTLLNVVEIALRLIGPFIKTPGTKKRSKFTEVDLRVHMGAHLPQGPVNISSKHAKADIQWETAAGHPSYYPGFTMLSLLTYEILEKSAGYFSGMKLLNNQSFEINSKVVTVTVSNRNTSHLEEPINLTFYHLKESNRTHKCVFWDSSVDEGTWSDRGCSEVTSNPKYTVCSCNHLSSFAVLMATYKIANKFELQLITWVGLPLSLVCLFICILTFSLIRSIKSPRTTIHLHLCISLFIATFIFLVGISHTENQTGCAVVAGLLHFFFMAAFCWMCLEGIQLFRMVVLVFNTNFKTLYMMAGGYGVPAVIVTISAITNAKGYGTERYCWLNLELIWSFFGPVCFIIIINIFFFLITAWKLAQKFSSLNPDLDSCQKIKAFIITAVAQLCVLGITWIFGCFQFKEDTIVMSYFFTIFASLQGVMLFVMHCLFSKQVREEYGIILSRICAPKKKRYSEFGYSNSSKAHGSKSTDTGESRI